MQLFPTFTNVAQKIAQGTGGQVYMAVIDGRTVAVKIIKGTRMDNPVAREVLIHRLCAMSGHPNVCPLLDVLSGPGPAETSVVFPYLDCSLKDVARLKLGRLGPDGRIDSFGERLLRGVMRELLSGVAHIHSLDVVHRDLKPENVLIDHEGRIRIIDFGLSRNGAADTYRVGSPNNVVTLNYRPAELLSGSKDDAAQW